MHDGSLESLRDVLAHYEAGGRTLHSGEHKGVGAASPLSSSFVNGFTLTPRERHDLIAFLESLTDPVFITDPAFSNPWPPSVASRSGLRKDVR